MSDERPTRKLAFGGKGDVYLEWGVATGFEYFQKGAGGKVGLLVEWHAKALQQARSMVVKSGIHVASVYTGERESRKPNRTWAFTIAADRVLDFFLEAEPLISRIELSSPLAPVATLPVIDRLRQTDAEVLVGLLDDGCPFYNQRFVEASGTRVLWLWNQDAEASGNPLNGTIGPSPWTDFMYGAQFSKDGLDKIITHRGPEQDAVYAATNLKKRPPTGIESLRRAVSHGAHVTDLLAGAAKWPIVFVQFARKDIEDPTGLWLQNAALDGLHYVLEAAGPKTRTVVANISWGPQTGPHDGSTILEKEIDRLVVQEKAVNGRTLIVSLAAGNSFGSRAHARFHERKGCELTWVVPPEADTPTFIEIWWPKTAKAADVGLRVTPPSGGAQNAQNAVPLDFGTWFMNLYDDPNQMYARASVIILPTAAADPAKRGSHGRWTLSVPKRASVSAVSTVHVYIPRADPNLGARRRAQSSYLTDAGLEAGRFRAPANRYDNPPGTAIDHRGTLSGIATGKRSKVAVGYVYRTLQPAPYSSSGRSRGPRWKPDYACMTDHAPSIPGLRATGNRSGSKVRLVGTSMAAPQMGRQLASSLESPFVMLPYDAERAGDECLSPRPELVPRE